MWEVISAISGLTTMIIMLFIEWPRILERWRESVPIRKKLFSSAYWGFVVIGFIFLQFGIWPNEQFPFISDNIIGQIGLWTFTSLLTVWALNTTIKKPKAIFTDFITFLTLIVFLTSLYLNVWVYYFSGLIT